METSLISVFTIVHDTPFIYTFIFDMIIIKSTGKKHHTYIV